jgi:WD40 repeat protein
MKRTIRNILFIGLSLLIVLITYHQFLYKAKRVDSNIFTLSKVLKAHHSHIWSVQFSPNGQLLASGSVDSTIMLWNKNDGSIAHSIKQPAGVTDIDFSPDGIHLLSTSYDGKVRVWKLPEGTLVKELVGHEGTVWSGDFSPDGKTISSSGQDATIRLWDLTTGELKKILAGHTLNIWDISFSPDGNTLASGSFDKTVRIWNVTDGKLLHTIRSHTEAVVSLAFSYDGKKLVTTSDDKTIRLWNTGDWSLIYTLNVPEHAQATAFTPDDKFLLTGGRDKPAIGELLQNFFGDSRYNTGVSSRLWNVKTGALLQTFAYHGNDVNDVAFSSDGKWMASGSSDKSITLWQLAGN